MTHFRGFAEKDAAASFFLAGRAGRSGCFRPFMVDAPRGRQTGFPPPPWQAPGPCEFWFDRKPWRKLSLTVLLDKKPLMRKIVCLLASMAVLSGCGTLKHNVAFEQPTKEPRARVRVVVPVQFNHYRGVRAFPNGACDSNPDSPGNGYVVASWYGFQENLTGQKLGMPKTELSDKKNTQQAEIFVAAEQPIVFRYVLPNRGGAISGTGRYATQRIIPGCTAAILFIPKAGADYELEFGFGQCDYTLFRLDDVIQDVRHVKCME